MTRRGSSSSNVVWSATDLAGNPHDAPDKAERVRSMFARIAPAYDLNNRVHSMGRDQAWRRRAVRLAAPRPGEDVLDVACGTGDLTEALAAARPASVTGIDFAEPMLEIARVKTARRRRPDGVPVPTYARGDAMALARPDAAFDVVTIAFGLRNVAEPAPALREFRRVLRPGGRLVVLEFDRPANPVLRKLNDIYVNRIMPVTASWLARDRSGAYRYLPRSVATFPERSTVIEMIADAGFTAVAAHPLTFGVCVAYLGRVEKMGSGLIFNPHEADCCQKMSPDPIFSPGPISRVPEKGHPGNPGGVFR